MSFSGTAKPKEKGDSKCPALHGAAVYLARSLYARVADTTIHYDDDSCNYTGSSSLYRITQARPEDVSEAQAYALYPNPNNGTFIIRQKIAFDKTVEVKIYNALGVQVAKETVEFNGGSANFKLKNAAPGLFLICLTDEQKKTTCIKFNVQ